MKKTILTILQSIFFGIVILVSLILLSSRVAIIGLRSFTVVTGSMEPKVHVGSVIFTLPTKIYKVGDVITFIRGNISVTHRIAGIKNGQYQTKGDANNSADTGLVYKSNIIGKDFLTIPYLGRFTNFLKTIPGFIIFVVLPSLIYIAFEIKSIKEELEKNIEKKLMSKLSGFGKI